MSSAAALPCSRSLSILVLGVALASQGCAASPAVRAAERGKYAGLREALAAELRGGRLGLSDAVSFARAVARGEIARAKGEEGAQQIRALRSCAGELDGELGSREGTRDTIGATAALVRVDAGLSSASGYRRWARTSSSASTAAWRALGARALVSHDDAALRRKLIADADEDVRRGALRASLEAADPEDTELVLEAARVDPSTAARAQALRTAGVIGGRRVVLALKDLWPRADEAVREGLVDAWATRGSFNSGGRDELVWVMDTQHGRPAITAAATLARAGSVEALGALERAVKEGSTGERVRGIEVASLAVPSLREAVRKAEGDPDDAVAAAAMTRRFEAAREVGGAVEGSPQYKELAAKLLKTAEGTGLAAVIAKGALARARDRRLLPILERDSVSREDKTRAEAGTALAVLGDIPRAAVVAADPTPRVRVAVACAILRAWAAK